MTAPRFSPLAVALMVAGIGLGVVGLGMLGIGRSLPQLAEQATALRGGGVAAVLAGGALTTAGIGIGFLGWGRTPREAYPSPGSHRAVIGSTMLAVVATIVFAVCVLLVAPGVGPRTTAGFLFLALGVDVALIGLCYLQGVRTGLVSRGSLGLYWSSVQPALRWGLGGGFLLILLSLANGLALRAAGLESPQAEAMRFIRDLPRPQFVLIAMAAAVAAPLAEELFFRGYVFRAYLAEKGPLVAYLGSAVIFGLMHGQLILLVAICSMGLVLAWLYQRSGTILAPMLAHAINNGIAFLALLAPQPPS